MIRTLFLVPERDNAGRRFRRAEWRMLQTRLLLAFGGFSRRRGVDGVWTAAGRTYRDRSREYTVALTTVWQIPAWLEIVEWACVFFGQEAIYLELAGHAEIIGPRTR